MPKRRHCSCPNTRHTSREFRGCQRCKPSRPLPCPASPSVCPSCPPAQCSATHGFVDNSSADNSRRTPSSSVSSVRSSTSSARGSDALPPRDYLTSGSCSSVQVDPAFACKCSECTYFTRKKNELRAAQHARRRATRATSTRREFACGGVQREHSTSGMGEDDGDKAYIADRYRLKYGNLCLLDVEFFAPKFGFEQLKRCYWK